MEFPTQFDRYTVEKHLGSGAFGHTFKVIDPGGEPLALKWLREDPDPTGPKRFSNEIWALSRLSHACIPALRGSGQHLRRPYLVMSLAEGDTLQSIYETQVTEGGSISQLRILNITEALLGALAHAQEHGIFHRDVKLANVIVSPSLQKVTLVDFGVCKGQGQPTDAATFWNAGASRTSPPSKLRHPTEVHATHDTFAVGVIAYTLLTNRYPWSVGTNEDRGHLENQMLRTIPQSIHDVNGLVSEQVSDFFLSLLRVEDDHRPSPVEALEHCRRILRDFQAATTSPFRTSRRGGSYPHVMRDPLHGDVPMTDYEWRLMATPEFQRLRWIKQLGVANLVYPGAEHTRFAHAVGTMHVASEVLRRMEERLGNVFTEDERLMARTYALVHDITHISCGHTLEDELNLFPRHDRNDARIERLLLSSKSRVGELLQSTEFGRAVLAHFDPGSTVMRRSWLTDLIEAPCGADVLDYVDRDSFHCGLDHKVDSAIFRRFAIDISSATPRQQRHILTQVWGKKGLRLDVEFALESLLRERFALFMKVYTHPSKIAAGAMIGKALREAAEGDKGSVLDERRLEWMSDMELFLHLKSSTRQASRQLAEQVLLRDLYKPVFRTPILKADQRDSESYRLRQERFAKEGLLDPSRLSRVEAELAKKAGLKASEVIVYCPPKAPGLQKVCQYVEVSPGKISFRDEVSGVRIYFNHMGLWEIYVLAPHAIDQNKRNRLAEASEELLKLENGIAFDRRQMVLPIAYQ